MCPPRLTKSRRRGRVVRRRVTGAAVAGGEDERAVAAAGTVPEPDPAGARVQALPAQLGVDGEAAVPVPAVVAVRVIAPGHGDAGAGVAADVALGFGTLRQAEQMDLRAGRDEEDVVVVLRNVRAAADEGAEAVLDHRQRSLRPTVAEEAEHHRADVARGEVAEEVPVRVHRHVHRAVEEAEVQLVEAIGAQAWHQELAEAELQLGEHRHVEEGVLEDRVRRQLDLDAHAQVAVDPRADPEAGALQEEARVVDADVLVVEGEAEDEARLREGREVEPSVRLLRMRVVRLRRLPVLPHSNVGEGRGGREGQHEEGDGQQAQSSGILAGGAGGDP